MKFDDDTTIAREDLSQFGVWTIDTFNPNRWSKGADVITRSAADVTLLQEMHVQECNVAGTEQKHGPL